jgi:hypothetical protein
MLHLVSKYAKAEGLVYNIPVGFIKDNKLVSAGGQSNLLLSETLDSVANHVNT